MNCEKKLTTATMQNRTQIPLICSLCAVTSLMAKVCKYTRFSNKAPDGGNRSSTANSATLTPRIWLNRMA